MPAYAFEDKKPRIAPSAFVHPQAVVIGNVSIGPDCFIGPGAVLRADLGYVEIGEKTSVQDNAVIHVNQNTEAIIGSGCVIAHGAVLHHPKLGNGVLVGINAVILHAAQIGDHCVIGALCMVREGSTFPKRKIITGNPGKAMKDVSDSLIKRITKGAEQYRQLVIRYRADSALLIGDIQ